MRNRYVLLADIAAVASAALGAFVLRFDWLFFPYRVEFFVFLAAALVIKPAVFYGFGLYRRYWRYATMRDLSAVVFACAATAVLMALFIGLALPLGLIGGFSRAALVIDSLLTLLAIGGIRMSVRVVYEQRRQPGSRIWPFDSKETVCGRRVLIVGAGNAGAMVAREMQRNPQLEMNPVAFVDDDAAKSGKRIHNVPVLGVTTSLGHITRIARIDDVVIAMPSAAGRVVRTIAETCQTLGLRSRTIPGVFELLDGKVSVSRLRHVEITDLLRRPQIAASTAAAGYIAGHIVLVTGAGGSIGSELCRQAAHARPKRLVMLGHGENSLFEAEVKLRHAYPDVMLDVVLADIRDRARIQRVFDRFAPDVVFHAAAHKHVHLMERNYEEAISTNVVGTQILVDAALHSGTSRFVAISTDKAVSPSGIMGASKRTAGIIVRDAARRSGRAFVVVRFGNVLGSRGSVVPVFKAQIERGGPVTITHPEMKRFFMTISEAVHLVLQAGGIAKGGELFVLDMGQPVKILDLAKDLIHLSGFTTDQIPITISGMRAGEKLEESLWERNAIVEPTGLPDVLRVVEPMEPTADVKAAGRALDLAAQAGDRVQIEAILCDLLPTYAPPPPSGAAEVGSSEWASGDPPAS